MTGWSQMLAGEGHSSAARLEHLCIIFPDPPIELAGSELCKG